MRLAAGVAAGIAVMLSARLLPVGNPMGGIAALLALAILAGFITGWIAGRLEIRCAGVLGCAMVAMAMLSIVSRRAAHPDWYEIALGGCGPVAGFTGAALRMLMKGNP